MNITIETWLLVITNHRHGTWYQLFFSSSDAIKNLENHAFIGPLLSNSAKSDLLAFGSCGYGENEGNRIELQKLMLAKESQ